MDARAALLVGTGTAIAAAVAVTCSVALTGANALADRPGTPIAGSAIVVHGHPGSASVAETEDAPETVAAPAPKDFAVPAPATTPPASTQKGVSAGDAENEIADAAKKAADKADAANSAETEKKADAAAKAESEDEAAAAQSAMRDSVAKAAKAGADESAKIRERLAEMTQKWKQRLSDEGRYAKDSVGRTEWNSGSGHPRPRSGSQKGQSHRSPDSSD